MRDITISWLDRKRSALKWTGCGRQMAGTLRFLPSIPGWVEIVWPPSCSGTECASRIAFDERHAQAALSFAQSISEIQERRLAKVCRYPADTLLAMLRNLSEQLPDEGLVLLRDVEVRGMARDVLAKLLDGLAAQCRATKRMLGIALRMPRQ
jgi:hypothetical protein